jgi:hypothetical protein
MEFNGGVSKSFIVQVAARYTTISAPYDLAPNTSITRDFLGNKAPAKCILLFTNPSPFAYRSRDGEIILWHGADENCTIILRGHLVYVLELLSRDNI